MAISRTKKEEIVKDLEKKFSSYTLVIFVNYKGLDVQSFETVRNDLRKAGIDIKVAKKTLLGLALKKLNISTDVKALGGQVAIVFGYHDAVEAAKGVYKFAKELEHFEILSGILEGEAVEASQIVAFAQIPSYEELLERLVGSLQAPLSGLVNVLSGNMRGLVQVLNAISQK